MTYFVNIYLAPQDVEPDFTKMSAQVLDLDLSLDRTAYQVDQPLFPIDSKQCDYHETFYNPSELFVQFTSVLVRLNVNFCLECMLELDLTVKDEKILIENIYVFASSLMYDIFDTNYRFFYEFLFFLFQKI